MDRANHEPRILALLHDLASDGYSIAVARDGRSLMIIMSDAALPDVNALHRFGAAIKDDPELKAALREFLHRRQISPDPSTERA